MQERPERETPDQKTYDAPFRFPTCSRLRTPNWRPTRESQFSIPDSEINHGDNNCGGELSCDQPHLDPATASGHQKRMAADFKSEELEAFGGAQYSLTLLIRNAGLGRRRSDG